MFKAFDNYINWLTKGFSHLVLGLFLPLIVVAVIIIGASSPKKQDAAAQTGADVVPVAEKATPDPHAVSNSDARKVCATTKDFVKNNLKAPSTAKFGDCIKDFGYTRDGDDWKVSGWVDAQNGFGAMIRNVFNVQVTATSNGVFLHQDIKLQPQ